MIVLVFLSYRRIIDTFRAVWNITAIFTDWDLIIYPKTLLCNALLLMMSLISWAAFPASRLSTLFLLLLLLRASWVWDLFVLFLATDRNWISFAHGQSCWSRLLYRDWLTWTEAFSFVHSTNSLIAWHCIRLLCRTIGLRFGGRVWSRLGCWAPSWWPSLSSWLWVGALMPSWTVYRLARGHLSNVGLC